MEIDALTGEFNLISTDIGMKMKRLWRIYGIHFSLVYDAGLSVNPAIDVGQCEGGFVQGVGFITTEVPSFHAYVFCTHHRVVIT